MRVAIFALSAVAIGLPGTSAADSRFPAEIQPLFAEKCLQCHGPDKQKGKLRLDQRPSALKRIESGELIARLTSDDPDERMPPKGPPLDAREIETVKAWIAQGAEFATHWAYRPLPEQRGALPAVQAEEWVRNPIDRFVLARLEREGIAPSPEADRPTLIKRLSYDLIGLPPTPEAVDTFCNAPDLDAAYATLVKELLASKHFGERWGRHWLDKARYADSDGYEKDNNRPNAWRYRDWVIAAINADLPMDQFTIEQLAGDLLPDPTPDQRLATAFHRQTLTNTEGGTDQEEFRVEATFDRTETTGTIWLGLSLTCARCHSHKYDAIPQSEYYRMFAFFNRAEETNARIPVSEEALATYRVAKMAHDEKLAAVDQQIAEARAGHEATFAAWQARLSDALAAQQPPAFHELADLAVTSPTEGLDFTIEDDGIVQVSGPNPDGELVYAATGKAPNLDAPLTGLRIDVLPDKRLPKNGPGRAENGNFVLNEVELSLGDQKLEFGAATADHSQQEFAATKLIDGSTGRLSGWAIAPQMGKPHHAILTLKQPVEISAATVVTARLLRNYDGGHSVGRFQLRLMTGVEQEQIAPKEIAKVLARAPEARDEKARETLRDHFLRQEFAATKPLYAAREALVKEAPTEPLMQVRVIGQKERETRVLERGSFLTPSEEVVPPGGISVLPPIAAREGGTPDRLDLARWLMGKDNPLPPRVLANQVWGHLFGEGLVRTMNDFGVRGDPPTHPELLDWLAAEYRRLGWSRKRLIETTVTSATYRQASVHRPELAEIDPENRLLARQNRFRVEAEIVRDLSLSAGGLLSEKVGGPSVFPPMPPEIAALSYAGNFKWATSVGEDRYRRGMYTYFKRTSPHPNLIAFDCPDSNTTNVKRRASNTPLQALTMLNNEVFVEAARGLAKRALALEANDDRDRMSRLLRFCIGRQPGESETHRFLDLLENSRAYFHSEPAAARSIFGGDNPNPEGAAWVSAARIALNLDEFITRE